MPESPSRRPNEIPDTRPRAESLHIVIGAACLNTFFVFLNRLWPALFVRDRDPAEGLRPYVC